MTLELQVYERILPTNKRSYQQKIIGHIVIPDQTTLFRFGKNPQTREFIPRIDSYAFLSEEQGRFGGEKKTYVFIPKGSSGISLRKAFRFWFLDFGVRETMLDNNEPIQVQAGDQFVSRDRTGRKEVVITVIQIY